MALIFCSECGNQVSDKAPACPKCGSPVNNSSVKQESFTKSPVREESKSSFKAVWYVVAIVLVIAALIAFHNNPNSIPGISVKVNTPKPLITTSRADDANASLLDFKETVYATISNQGGDGNVIVNFHLTQNGNTFTKTKIISMKAGESVDESQIFDEVKRLGGNMQFSVDAQAR